MLTLDLVRLDVTHKLAPTSWPSPAFPFKLLEETHTVATPPLLPIRLLPLTSAQPMFDTNIVMLVEPVVAKFARTKLLPASDVPPKLTARLKLPILFDDVAKTLALDSTPLHNLLKTLLDDTQADPALPLNPIRHRSLLLTVPTFDTTTVMLVDPVVAPLVGSTRITNMYSES